MLQSTRAEVFQWPFGTIPERVESDQLWPGDAVPFASFTLTRFDDMPSGYDSIEPIVAHYREDTPHQARRLLVFESGGCMVPWIDEYHPDLGFETEYLSVEAGQPMRGVWQGDPRLPYGSEELIGASEKNMPKPVSQSNTNSSDTIAGTPTGLAWGKMAPSREFLEKIVAIADEVETDPSFLLTQFYGESRFLPQAHLNNSKKGLQSSSDPTTIGKHTIGGGLFGLMRQWAKPAIGIPFDEFIQMDALGQLDYARKFYLGAKGKLRTMNDVFIYTFYPAALGKKDSFIIAKKGEPAYDQNKHFDTNHDGTITKGEASATRFALYKEGLEASNRLDYADLATFTGTKLGALPFPRVPEATELAVVPKYESAIGAVRSHVQPAAESFRVMLQTQGRLMTHEILDLCCHELEAKNEEEGLTRSEKKLLRRMLQRLLDDAVYQRLRLAEGYYLQRVEKDETEGPYMEALGQMAETLSKKKKKKVDDVLLLFGIDHVLEQQEGANELEPVSAEILLEEDDELSPEERLEEWTGILAKLLARAR